MILFDFVCFCVILCVQANMRVKIRGADDFLDVGQPVDYAKLMTQASKRSVDIINVFLAV